jgi:pyruvate-ferredoxin/flavodoxin oxidoreductase
MLQALASEVGQELVTAILDNPQKSEADIYEQRESVAILKERLAGLSRPEARRLLALADMLVRKTVWIIGGDGWAYDIDYGGLDHVLASGSNVNVLVMDTEVYSNTGGQASKATPRGAVAKFAAGGKRMGKKDLGLIAMTYGNIYVARVAMGARDEQTLRAFIEAEAYEGPSLIIAYSHCIAHGINMATAMQNQKAAVESGQWLLYRFNPDRALQGENPLQLDSRPPKIPVKDYLAMESRFSMLNMIDPERAKMLQEESQRDVENRWAYYEFMAQRTFDGSNGNGQKS